TAWLLLNYFATTDQYGGVLLLVYWSLNLPVLGEEVAQIAHQYPLHRNVTLRLLEPLGAPEETASGTGAITENHQAQDVDRKLEVAAAASLSAEAPGFILVKPSVTRDERIALNGRESASNCRGVRLTIDGVSVRAAGHVILEDVNLEIEPGSHVAIVGPSGAGKSSLAGLLLGWHKATGGRILVDGEALDSERLERLREETAWVDPAVQLWNRSLLENLSYGAPPEASTSINSVIEGAELRRVLEKLPEGFQTPLGESGSLLSGGEGQRVRLGRAMLRGKARLAILDEAFRGLSRERRRGLLSGARKLWQGATLLCITHDVGETQAFERVLVIDGGRIVEDGDPADLMEQAGSRYRELVEAEETLRAEMWASDRWHNIRLEGGQIVEGVQRS
ncbi:MAG TPA: ABC transporter ATP-binding protein, partial [Blastocatellia bacterium]|nr:ABC transporter ATP-binding protein [Blastocatellia bacterium]